MAVRFIRLWSLLTQSFFGINFVTFGSMYRHGFRRLRRVYAAEQKVALFICVYSDVGSPRVDRSPRSVGAVVHRPAGRVELHRRSWSYCQRTGRRVPGQLGHWAEHQPLCSSFHYAGQTRANANPAFSTFVNCDPCACPTRLFFCLFCLVCFVILYLKETKLSHFWRALVLSRSCAACGRRRSPLIWFKTCSLTVNTTSLSPPAQRRAVSPVCPALGAHCLPVSSKANHTHNYMAPPSQT